MLKNNLFKLRHYQIEKEYDFAELDGYTYESLKEFKQQKADQLAYYKQKRYELIASILFYQSEVIDLIDDISSE